MLWAYNAHPVIESRGRPRERGRLGVGVCVRERVWELKGPIEPESLASAFINMQMGTAVDTLL